MACGNCGNNNVVVPTPAQLLKGIKSVTELALSSVSHASKEVIEDRRNKCRECPEATRNDKLKDRPSKGLTSWSQCRLCSCVIKWKTMAKDETCPLNKW